MSLIFCVCIIVVNFTNGRVSFRDILHGRHVLIPTPQIGLLRVSLCPIPNHNRYIPHFLSLVVTLHSVMFLFFSLESHFCSAQQGSIIFTNIRNGNIGVCSVSSKICYICRAKGQFYPHVRTCGALRMLGHRQFLVCPISSIMAAPRKKDRGNLL